MTRKKNSAKKLSARFALTNVIIYTRVTKDIFRGTNHSAIQIPLREIFDTFISKTFHNSHHWNYYDEGGRRFQTSFELKQWQ